MPVNTGPCPECGCGFYADHPLYCPNRPPTKFELMKDCLVAITNTTTDPKARALALDMLDKLV